jgi:hypothetical protein
LRVRLSARRSAPGKSAGVLCKYYSTAQRSHENEGLAQSAH